MKSMRVMLLILVSLLLHQRAMSAISISVQEVGDDVVFSYSGTLDLTGMTADGAGGSAGILVPNNGQLTLAGALLRTFSYYDGGSGWGPYGTGGISVQTGNLSGDHFEVFAPTLGLPAEIGVPTGFVSGSALSGSSTFFNASLASLGLTEGTYTTNLPNDQITMVIAIPEPGAVGLFSAWVLCQALFFRRRA